MNVNLQHLNIMNWYMIYAYSIVADYLLFINFLIVITAVVCFSIKVMNEIAFDDIFEGYRQSVMWLL